MKAFVLKIVYGDNNDAQVKQPKYLIESKRHTEMLNAE